MFIDVNGWEHIGNIKTSTIVRIEEENGIDTKKYVYQYITYKTKDNISERKIELIRRCSKNGWYIELMAKRETKKGL